MRIYNNITEVFGNTPLVTLNKVTDGAKATVLAKLEFYNPSSSVKDRLGIAMVDAAEKSGALKPGGTLIEATSGNTGISLAMVGAARGYKTIIVMPDSMSMERKILIRAYGAELVLTPAAEGMKGSVAKADELGKTIENSVMMRQFDNETGPDIHRRTTAEEIWADTDGQVAALVAGSGTGDVPPACAIPPHKQAKTSCKQSALCIIGPLGQHGEARECRILAHWPVRNRL